ncbi:MULTISPECIES: RAQPRD family integrative conjugative element protein [Gammaproteobacteria]|jgi:RAQPRD family integrative conjugative element protein|uniref:integrative conjugative element protein, RAQPRD family n=1 Tax=Gammaproteobacteria TaxID=1236 RepID=UPI001E375480|nr:MULTISPECIES: RAQPRD family integrative conjugative element protein [Gammaproteobacteria]EIU1655459.1 raqprd family integrative conjugative element protein [Pseudomonas aeruginosa]MCD5963418.1 raqprd family integrative conjugative element protein [Stenotrophomonas maltophilia]MCG7023967.1 raqprd family integrative conjugative element protein [Pseudomonas aeruginosa]MCG7035530.1 raqprd family integrative conjugative element protein [Pseudomonas aeruginosa]MCG7041227.1 raqprd family integrati
MGQTNYRTSACPLLAALLVMLLAAGQPASASDDAIEREQLAALVRQIDLIDHQAEYAVLTAQQQRARYHFDHARLREDLQRVRAGIQDYLTPPRAQPRDPVELSGDYRQSSPPSDQEAPQ